MSVLGISVLLAASSFTWQVGSAPRGALGCDAEARAFGDRFHAATGLAVTAAACVGETAGGFDLSLSYSAEHRVAVVPAVFGLFWSASNDRTVPADLLSVPPLWGMYGDEAGCLAAVPAQKAQYERETGLPAVAAYCAKGLVGGSILRIDGFGATARRYQQIDAGFPADVDAPLAEAVAKLVAQSGATIVDARPWGPHVLVSFYGDPEAGVLVRVPGYFGRLDDQESCAAELVAAKGALAVAGAPAPALAVCLGDSFDGSSHLALAFTGGVDGAPFVERRGPTYGSYGDCAASRAAAVAVVQADTDRKVGGVVCVRESPTIFRAVALTH